METQIIQGKMQKLFEMGLTSIYESQLTGCLMEFGRITTQIAEGIEPPENEGDRVKIVEAHNHHENLC